MDDICVVHIGWIKGGTAIQSPFASPYGMQRAFLLFQMDTTSARRFTAKRKAVLINVLSESFCT